MRRLLRLLLHVAGVLAGVAAVLLALLAWRLAQGPLPLDLLAPRFEAAFDERMPGLRLGLEGAELAWGDWQETFELRLAGVTVADTGGRRLLTAPAIAVEMDLPPLARGELRPLAIVATRPTLAARLGADGVAAAWGGAVRPAEACRAQSWPAPFERLDEVLFQDAVLELDDRLSGRSWRLPATFSLRRGDDGTVLAGRALAAGLRISCRPASDDGGEIALNGSLDGLTAASLAALVPDLAALAGVEIAFDTRFELRFDDTLELLAGSFELASAGGRIDLEEVFAAPFALGPARAEGRLHAGFAGLELQVHELGLESEESAARLALDGFSPDAGLEFRLDVAGLAVDDLGRYWPLRLASDTRSWLMGNLSGGRIDDATLAFATTPGALLEDRMATAALAVAVDVSGSAIAGLGTLPPLVGVDGRVRIRDDRLRIATEGGRLAGLALGRGTIAMERLAGDAPMRIQARLSGPLAAALAVANREPFALSARLGLEPAAVRGDFEGQVEVVLPRLDGLEAGTVRYRAAIDARRAGLERPLFGYRLAGGEGSVTVDGDSVAAEGVVRVNGVPFRARYRHLLAAGAPLPRRAWLEGRLDDQARRLLGFADPVAMTGPAEVAIEARQAADGQVAWRLEADLAPVAMAFPLGGLAKQAGEPGRLELEAVDSGGGELTVTALLEAGGVTLEGGGRVDARDGRPLDFQIARLAFGRNRIAATLRSRPDGTLAIALMGGEADMDSLLGDDVATAGGTLPPLLVEGRLDRLWTAPGAAIEALTVAGRWDDGRWQTLAAGGRNQGGSAMTAEIRRAGPGERRLDYRAADAGDALRTFGLFETVEGGSMEIAATLEDGAPAGVTAGTVRIDDFVLHEVPLLARLLSLISLPAILDALAGSGLAFQSAVLPFRKQGDEVAFHDARMFGPGIGITFAGTVDLASEWLELEGTLVPAYLLNALPGEIPILGDILTGGEEGGGVFAFAFQAQGALDDPAVTVHPLSILTPGFLRRIFQAPDGDAAVPEDRDGR